ncbi:SERPINE1 mRNA-binding protein 1 isoform X2 [Hyperolius riggenbachi]|uniref:SERPINE1 mRNA-binding protein 1 isoform X2 n=1 Tax=Hyperolius riggenbachi TaxID=752182 RepID=UPI0035A3CA59
MPGHLQEGFGCIVTNRFDQLFDDESDPFEVLKAAENKKKEATGAQAKSAAQAAKQPKKESQKERRNPLPERKEEPAPPVPLKKEGIRRVGRRPEQQQQPQQQQPPQQQPPQAQQGEGKPVDRRPTERRQPRERRFEKPAEEKGEGGEFSVDRPIGERPPRGRGGPGGRGRGGRGRGIGRGDGFDSRGKREFDRHSGSDRAGPKHEDKRGGSGSHNWGNVKDEMSELDQSTVTEETTETEEQPTADSENKENEAGEEVKEEGPKEMTLDEWKAMQDKARSKVEFNIRKPNEGADGQWKKGFVLHKAKSEEVSGEHGVREDRSGSEGPVMLAHSEAEGLDHHFRKPANDITSQLEINFGDLGRPGRGRGGGRGGRGRGGGGGRGRGGRSDKSSVSAPDVDDPEAFPALA